MASSKEIQAAAKGMINKNSTINAPSQTSTYQNIPDSGPGFKVGTAASLIENIPYWQQQIKAHPENLKQRYADINRQASLELGQALGGMNQFSASPGVSDDIARSQQAAQMMGQAYNQRMAQANTISEAEQSRDANLMALEERAAQMAPPEELVNAAIETAVTQVVDEMAKGRTHTEGFAVAQNLLERHSEFPQAEEAAAMQIAQSILSRAQEVHDGGGISVTHYLGKLLNHGLLITNPYLQKALSPYLDPRDQHFEKVTEAWSDRSLLPIGGATYGEPRMLYGHG